MLIGITHWELQNLMIIQRLQISIPVMIFGCRIEAREHNHECESDRVLLNGTHIWEKWKSMVVLRGFPLTVHSLGLSCNDLRLR